MNLKIKIPTSMYISELTINGTEYINETKNGFNGEYNIDVIESECEIEVVYSKLSPKDLKKKICNNWIEGLGGYTLDEAMDDTKIVHLTINACLSESNNLLEFDCKGNVDASTLFVNAVYSEENKSPLLLRILRIYYFSPIFVMCLCLSMGLGFIGIYALLKNEYGFGLLIIAIPLILDLIILKSFLKTYDI